MKFLPAFLPPQPSERAAPPAQKAASRPANPVLGLQQQVGNHTVMDLLHGDGGPVAVPATTDPRLNWTLAAQQEDPGLDRERVPFNDPLHAGRSWDAQAILARLTQLDDDPGTFTDAVRCGANAVLAIAIMSGPEAVMRLVIGLIKRGAELYADTKLPAPRRAQCFSAAIDLIEVGPRIAYEKTTYGELSRVAHCAKVLMSDAPTSSTTGHEVNAMGALVGETQDFGTPIIDQAQLVTYAKTLAPGEAFTLLVDSDVLAEDEDRRSLSQVNHYVTLGREPDAPGRKGRIYLYDPWPRVGSQLLYSNDTNFWAYFTTAGGRWKSVYKVTRTRPG